ncbi:MAG TPA: NAD(P)H-hydrate dehydratase [Arenimonas sp.]|nr:NAD(P)H-hydrate dehydratase [Arenimonas sp.]
MNDLLPLYRPASMRRIDPAAADELGIDTHALMERAGAAAFEILRQRWPRVTRIGVACGPGNNGGDGYVLARLAQQAGLEVQVVTLSGAEPKPAEARQAARDWKAARGTRKVFDFELPQVELWVDSIYGIGLSRKTVGLAESLIERINASRLPVLALDVPSGLDADRGCALGTAIRATATVSFIAGKRGLHTGQARDHTGDWQLASLGLPEDWLAQFPAEAWLARPGSLLRWLSPRHPNAHKGEYGHVLCIGGEIGMGGAVRLCAEAALRTGVGLASVATRKSGVAALVAARPEAMTHAVEDAAALQPLLERASVLAVGPGLGTGDWGRSLLDAALASGRPAILDADALNLLAESPRPVPLATLTPHPGEAARLLGSDNQSVQKDRFAALAAMVERYQCVVVLKGAGTLVGAPGEVPVVIGAGNPGMAAGGMGDVLTGVIAALQAQHLGSFEAAVAGALLHGAAGDAAARIDGERGLLPSDLFPHLRRLANPA